MGSKTLEYSSIINQKEIMSLAEEQMDQDITICSEANQREREKYLKISLTGGIYQSIQMNYYTKQEQTHKPQKPTYAYQKKKKLTSVQLLSHVRLFVTPWTAAHQASLSITNSRSLPKLMSIDSVVPSNHLILCHPLLLLSSICHSIGVFSNESALHNRWPKYWSFSFNISPSNEHPGLISFRMDWLDLIAVQGILKSFSNTTVQKHQFFGAQLSL